jgi:hypothetical protein
MSQQELVENDIKINNSTKRREKIMKKQNYWQYALSSIKKNFKKFSKISILPMLRWGGGGKW